jgi:hypothetical protein
MKPKTLDLGATGDKEDEDLFPPLFPATPIPAARPAYFSPDVLHVDLRHDTMQHEYAVIGRRISEQGRVVAEAIYACGMAEAEAKRIKARLFLQARATLRVEGGKEPAAATIENTVMGDPRYSGEWLSAVQKQVEAEARKAKARTDLDSLMTDRDMLIQAGSDRRKEMLPDLNLRNEASDRLRPPVPNAGQDE